MFMYFDPKCAPAAIGDTSWGDKPFEIECNSIFTLST